MIRVDDHPKGPRVYVLGQRVHEVALGLGLLGVLAVLFGARLVRSPEALAPLAIVGGWLVWKDWRDLLPRYRNTCSHRRFGMHEAAGRRFGVPPTLLAAAATLTVAFAELVEFSMPQSGPAHLVAHIAPPSKHALALPLVGALLPVAAGLRQGRRDAAVWAVALLGGLGTAFIIDGHQYDWALVCTVVAAWLVGARSWFVVELARPSLRRLLGTAVLAGLGVPPLLVLLEGDHRDGTTGTLGLMCVLSFAGAASLALGRRIAPVAAAGARDRAADLVRTFGSDTLDAFKLRDDARYLESPSGKAVLAYRLSAGVMLVAGDPVGPVSEIPALLGRAREIAARHGLRLAVLNAGSRAAATWRAAGLRGLYLGDEAIVDIDGFSLEGRSIRKVRQSVTRLRKAGYTASVESVRLLPPAERGHLAGLAALWRGAAPERGFTMACTLEDAAADDGLVAVARDADGVARALMLLLPAYGRSAYSLALMRRDPNTPNGLTEFMVADTIERLGERGVAELSLNFAFLGRCLRGGDSRRLRAVRRLLRLGDRWFQLERLYRFNDKFFPRWQPRYLLVESFRTMPRTALSAMVVEGLLPGLPVRPWRR